VTYKVASAGGLGKLKPFLSLPRLVYANDPSWVAPLISEVCRTLDTARNPYFSGASLRLFVCFKNEAPAARLAIVISRPHERKFGRRTAFFGYFESINDPEAANVLFRTAEDYCRAEGAAIMEGPFNPNHYSELGLQVDRFGTPPAFFQPYNPSYYADLLEGSGFRVSQRFQTMKNEDIGPYLLRRYGPPRELRDKNGFVVRAFRPADAAAELERIREVNNEAFADNWHFLPLSREEYDFSAKYMSLVTRPELIFIAEHRGAPAAVLHCVLDINPLLRRLKGRVGPLGYLGFRLGRRRVRNLIIFTVAIRPPYRHSSVYYLLLRAFQRAAASYETVETTWMSPDNVPALRSAGSLGMRPDKHFAIYEKTLKKKSEGQDHAYAR
jgi:hypothetical protein